MPIPYQARSSNRAPKISTNRSRSQRTHNRSIFRYPDQTPNCPSYPPTNIVPRRRNQDNINQTKPVSITVSQSNSQSLSQSPNQDRERTPDLLINPTITQSIFQTREIKITPELSSSRYPENWIYQRTRKTKSSRYPSRYPNRYPV